MGLNAKWKRVVHSFSYAFEGMFHGLKNELNIKIHAIVAVSVIWLGFWFHLSGLEWVLILLTIGAVISLELLNTAIERVVDLASPEVHPLAKQAKDLAAGAVLFFAFIAVIIGFIIFLPKLTDLFC